jgi:hypothetical protein
LQEDLPTKIANEKKAYDAAIASAAAAAAAATGEAEVDLNMHVLIKYGDELIADSEGAGFLAACATFEAYVSKRYP